VSAPVKHFHVVRHPDDESFFDTLTIECVERWKESELSGDEWRFSFVVTLWRKGMMVRTRSFSRMQWAKEWMPSASPAEMDEDMRVPPGQVAWTREADEELCCQPGCVSVAVVEYRRLKDWCSTCGNAPESKYAGWDTRRRFCLRHMGRGDCALDDADHNYEAMRTRDALVGAEWDALPEPVKVDSPEWSAIKSRLRAR
jgi:hypothetical protein